MLFRGRSRNPVTYKDGTLCNNSNKFQPLFFVTKGSILNAARVLDPPMPKAKKVEQITHMVSNHSY